MSPELMRPVRSIVAAPEGVQLVQSELHRVLAKQRLAGRFDERPRAHGFRSPLVDGAAAADGAVVTALNQDGESAGPATIADGTWVLAGDAAATSVTFSIDGSAQTAAFPVVSGDLTEVTIDVSSGAAPAGLPNTGSGGLADTSGGVPFLPVALAIAAVVALGGVAVTRRAQLGVR